MQKAQTGSRVYGGTTTSPNMGQVSAKGAQGYLKREMRNRNQGGVVRPVGNDGKSDSRSGVAQRALNNNLGGRPQGASFGGIKQQGGAKNPLANKQKPQTAQPVGAQSPMESPQPDQVRVNDQGLLELPYSQNMSQGALQALKDSNDELLALQQEEQQMQQQVQQGRRDADIQYGQLKTQTLGNNAAGGTAFSSMYGKAVGDNANAYSNTLADLSKQESDFNQNASARRAAIQNSLSQQLSQYAQDNAVELGDDAGTLGYGNYTAPTNNHGPAKHPERHPKPNKVGGGGGNSNTGGGGKGKGKGKK